MDEAISIVRSMTAYTNHTILAEALEKWPLEFLQEVVPHLVPIIEELDRRVRAEYKDPAVQIIDENDRVHMAHMDIHYGYSVNGWQHFHQKSWKNSELKAFYDIYPEKFNNKTNGITFRRWLMQLTQPCHTTWDDILGRDWHHDASKLKTFFHMKIKMQSKAKFGKHQVTQQTQIGSVSWKDHPRCGNQSKFYLWYPNQTSSRIQTSTNERFVCNPTNTWTSKLEISLLVQSLFSLVVKQLLPTPLHKIIIHLILCLSEVIANDPTGSPHLQVVMVENYNVTAASYLIPASDISEQISLASKEASGTGNMKFMLNGALTLGTMDGANVEIAELVDDNIYIFGEDSGTVIDLYAKSAYKPATSMNVKPSNHW